MKFNLYVKGGLVTMEASSQHVRDKLRDLGIKSTESKVLISETIRVGKALFSLSFGDVEIYTVLPKKEPVSAQEDHVS
jgi:hypothetical protein